jgi:hypothetical protein
MKKFFTLTLLMCLAVCANAQRKTWDFTKGFSATTIANLEADTKNWTPSESGAKKWAESKARTGNTEASCEVNGEEWIIPETKGIIFHAASAKHLNIVYQEGSDDTHVWLNGAKGEDAITIPDVPAGEKITVTYSSHGGKDDRGFKVSTAGVADEEGTTEFRSAGQATVVLINSNTETTNVKLSALTGGMHFYKIVIGEGDAVQATKVAYLYDGAKSDQVLTYLQANELYDVNPIVADATELTAEALRDYAVTVVGRTVTAGKTADVLKEVLPWTPVLNLNASLYAAWGYGEAVPCGNLIVLKNTKSELFQNVPLIEDEGIVGMQVNNGEAMLGVTLGEYFADDPVLATAYDNEEAVAIHTHNIRHNGYVFLPFDDADITPEALLMVDNAINMLQSSKADITAANAPVINRVYKHQQTLVSIKAPSLPKAQVFYTTDGSEPTLESALYEGEITLTQPCTVKAVAIAEGYTLSNVASLDVLIKEQPKTPAISYEMQGEKTTVTITCESEDADIWYNFTDAGTDTLKSTKYVDSVAVEITMPQNVTAFAVTGGEVFSEPTTQRVLVQQPRVVIDVAGHFAAPQWTGDNNAAGLSVANGKGMFSWGASAVSMYIGEGTTTIETDPETGDEIEVVTHSEEDLRPYEVVSEAGENPEWVLTSRGTCLIWQNTTAQTTNFGDNSNYNPMYSTDVDPLFPITKNDIQFYKFQSGEPGNGSIQSINKYQAPLDVVVLANMQGGPLLVQVSADSLEWTTIGEIAKTGQSRLWSKYTNSYNGSDEVYVRVTEEAASGGPKVFDIYVANQGEKSKALLEELNQELTGIEEILVPATTKAAAGIYSLSGMRTGKLQRGLNIVVTGNGQVRKVMMK